MELKIDEQQQAQNLYYQTELSNAEIAGIVGVSTRTISRWISRENWQRIKTAARRAPSALVEKLYRQLNKLLDHIDTRTDAHNFPTKDEADIIRKLTSAIEKLKQQTGLCETIDLMMRFTTHVSGHNLKLAQEITREANDFMKGDKAELHKPFELMYGREDNDCRYEDDAEASPDNEVSHIANAGQSTVSTPNPAKPLPVNGLTEQQQAKNDPSLSSENISTMQTPITGKETRPSGLSKDQADAIIAQEQAKDKALARRMRDRKRFL